MKKTLLALIAITCFLSTIKTIHAQDNTGEHKYKIYAVVWNGCDSACKGFRSYLDEKKFPYEFILRDAKNDDSVFPVFVDEARSKDVDLVITWGTATAMGMLGSINNYNNGSYIKDIPAIFMVVAQPISVGLVSNYASSARNITGVLHIVPEEAQIKIAREYIPFKKLGIIYNPQESASMQNVAALREIAVREGFNLLEEPIPLDANGMPVDDSIKYQIYRLAERGAEMVYVGVDAFINLRQKEVADACVEKGLPIFSVAESAVMNGNALITVSNHYYNIGMLAGKKAFEILNNNIKPYDIPINMPEKKSIIINISMAKKIGIYPPLLLLDKSEIVE